MQKTTLKYWYSNCFLCKERFLFALLHKQSAWNNIIVCTTVVLIVKLEPELTVAQEHFVKNCTWLFKAILFFILSFCTHCFPVKIEFLKVHSIFTITVILNLSHYLCVHANSAIKGHIFQCFIWDAIHHVCCVCYILWAEFVGCLLFSQTLPVYLGFSPLTEN